MDGQIPGIAAGILLWVPETAQQDGSTAAAAEACGDPPSEEVELGDIVEVQVLASLNWHPEAGSPHLVIALIEQWPDIQKIMASVCSALEDAGVHLGMHHDSISCDKLVEVVTAALLNLGVIDHVQLLKVLDEVDPSGQGLLTAEITDHLHKLQKAVSQSSCDTNSSSSSSSSSDRSTDEIVAPDGAEHPAAAACVLSEADSSSCQEAPGPPGVFQLTVQCISFLVQLDTTKTAISLRSPTGTRAVDAADQHPGTEGMLLIDNPLLQGRVNLGSVSDISYVQQALHCVVEHAKQQQQQQQQQQTVEIKQASGESHSGVMSTTDNNAGGGSCSGSEELCRNIQLSVHRMSPLQINQQLLIALRGHKGPAAAAAERSVSEIIERSILRPMSLVLAAKERAEQASATYDRNQRQRSKDKNTWRKRQKVKKIRLGRHFQPTPAPEPQDPLLSVNVMTGLQAAALSSIEAGTVMADLVMVLLQRVQTDRQAAEALRTQLHAFAAQQRSVADVIGRFSEIAQTLHVRNDFAPSGISAAHMQQMQNTAASLSQDFLQRVEAEDCIHVCRPPGDSLVPLLSNLRITAHHQYAQADAHAAYIGEQCKLGVLASTGASAATDLAAASGPTEPSRYKGMRAREGEAGPSRTPADEDNEDEDAGAAGHYPAAPPPPPVMQQQPERRRNQYRAARGQQQEYAAADSRIPAGDYYAAPFMTYDPQMYDHAGAAAGWAGHPQVDGTHHEQQQWFAFQAQPFYRDHQQHLQQQQHEQQQRRYGWQAWQSTYEDYNDMHAARGGGPSAHQRYQGYGLGAAGPMLEPQYRYGRY